MAHICLWGNASDLSFSLQGEASSLQENHLRTDANKNILVVCHAARSIVKGEKLIVE
jgi:hypothetical protein